MRLDQSIELHMHAQWLCATYCDYRGLPIPPSACMSMCTSRPTSAGLSLRFIDRSTGPMSHMPAVKPAAYATYCALSTVYSCARRGLAILFLLMVHPLWACLWCLVTGGAALQPCGRDCDGGSVACTARVRTDDHTVPVPRVCPWPEVCLPAWPVCVSSARMCVRSASAESAPREPRVSEEGVRECNGVLSRSHCCFGPAFLARFLVFLLW